MNGFQKDIVAIIRTALTGEKSPLSQGFDLVEGLKLVREHSIDALFCEGVMSCGVTADEAMLAAFRNMLIRSVYIDARQADMLARLTAAFDAEGIDYLPLKGALLKKLYPKPEMRSMGDADILIREEQYSRITPLLEKLGFEFKYESDHELVWSTPALFLELHKRIMTTYNRDFYAYFGNGWAAAQKADGSETRYEFKPEDFYIYIFAHFTKHFRLSGIGIKHILDLWVYRRAHRDMDEKYISDVLERLQLTEFRNNIDDTLAVWFEGAEPNPKTDFITNAIFASGQYGSAETANINRAIRDSKSSGSVGRSKLKSFLSSAFLPYGEMKKRYPVLKPLPFLLPVMWVVRWVDTLVFRRKNMRGYIKSLNAINKDSVNEHISALRYIGLDFNI